MSLQMTISDWMKMEENSLNGLKTLCEKEKLLVTSNLSFSHSVFKTLVLQTHENQGLFEKGIETFALHKTFTSYTQFFTPILDLRFYQEHVILGYFSDFFFFQKYNVFNIFISNPLPNDNF